MESKQFDITSLQSKNFQLNNSTTPINVDVFGETQRAYLNELQLFTARFNTIPNFISEVKINCKKANYWFVEKYKTIINDVHFLKIQSRKSNQTDLDEVFYFLYDDLLVNFDIQCSVVRFLFRQTSIEKVENIVAEIKKHKHRKNSRVPKINLVVETYRGIETSTIDLTKPKLSISDNYNDDFKEVHQTIYKKLSMQNGKGLVLLHGKPGTGKTSYIRYLIASVKKDVIFLPPSMASNITNPSLMALLIKNPNSIFVIEDAENIIIDRETSDQSPVSTLLNISDGLLSDCLNIQIICSFNTDISKVDSALMRKGRLIAKYEFRELDVLKAQQLSDKLNFKSVINKPMTLSEIYNQTDMDFKPKNQRNSIGFFANNN
ncbi:MAG: AAA family ATPase [Chitinophagaceae bacterium]|mgnify:CR=1 FL=1|jgi:hypothetical protein|nr:AAA family ATPase [Chitinophagaceae bacterium]MBP9739446.1 AAA family ATPase [Chitinophagaceae bacterium]